jgi:hypothetical protein
MNVLSNVISGLIVFTLRVGLVVVLLAAGWLIYKQLPPPATSEDDEGSGPTTLQIVLRGDQNVPASFVDVPVELFPIDIVGVRHEFFAERRAGERFEDFLKQRMKGRAPIVGKLDPKGQTTLTVTPGNWWIHATLPGDEELEWRLPISVGGRKQIVELTPQNAYTRSKSF